MGNLSFYNGVCPLLFWIIICRLQYTPLKTNIRPKNGWLEDYFPFGMASWKVRTVSFRESRHALPCFVPWENIFSSTKGLTRRHQVHDLTKSSLIRISNTAKDASRLTDNVISISSLTTSCQTLLPGTLKVAARQNITHLKPVLTPGSTTIASWNINHVPKKDVDFLWRLVYRSVDWFTRNSWLYDEIALHWCQCVPSRRVKIISILKFELCLASLHQFGIANKSGN